MLRVLRPSSGCLPPARRAAAPPPSLYGNVPYRLSRGGARLRHYVAQRWIGRAAYVDL